MSEDAIDAHSLKLAVADRKLATLNQTFKHADGEANAAELKRSVAELHVAERDARLLPAAAR